jgi:hypothetical protein
MLKYKALWIDDTIDSAETKAVGIKEFLAEEGFVFEPIIRENARGINTYLNDPDLDIVITDYNLARGTAEKLIPKIRQAHRYIEIVLYSENPPRKFREVLGKFEGVYGCVRSNVETTIRNVIKSTIRRTQHVSNMRGIVISEAIDIENQIEGIILSYYKKREKILAKELLGGDGCNELGPKIKYLKDVILKGIIVELNNDISTGNENKKNAAKELLKKLEPLSNIAKDLYKDVCMTRNMLAHVEHVINGSVICLKAIKGGYEDILIDTNKCKDIRQSLMKHATNLNNIEEFIPKWHEYKKTGQRNK